MNEQTETPVEPQLELVVFRKFHVLKGKSFSVSFCLVYIGHTQAIKACQQVNALPSWQDDMIYHGSAGAIKIYQPAMIEENADDSLDAVIFVLHQTDEDFCELSIKRETAGGKNPQIVCFRERDHIRSEDGTLVEKEGALFGFGMPHPWKKSFVPNPDYVRLVEHRPNTDPDWPGFEPVWLKVKEGEASPRYYKLEIAWTDNTTALKGGGNPIVVFVKELKEGEEIPPALKSHALSA